ncbi:hypothetical protein VMCG_00871 [Cytospora schulzeri]|uniref:Uncharacterized protein n=1 Tax=Cytospora schulzeri TaxID=448051 RepID=A0A423X504_9PEZI|nr:hypothetical protein VMCG_00871 [Valsa malicola]
MTTLRLDADIRLVNIQRLQVAQSRLGPVRRGTTCLLLLTGITLRRRVGISQEVLDTPVPDLSPDGIKLGLTQERLQRIQHLPEDTKRLRSHERPVVSLGHRLHGVEHGLVHQHLLLPDRLAALVVAVDLHAVLIRTLEGVHAVGIIVPLRLAECDLLQLRLDGVIGRPVRLALGREIRKALEQLLLPVEGLQRKRLVKYRPQLLQVRNIDSRTREVTHRSNSHHGARRGKRTGVLHAPLRCVQRFLHQDHNLGDEPRHGAAASRMCVPDLLEGLGDILVRVVHAEVAERQQGAL